MDRISAVILKNKKLLLVTGYDKSFYWTPGGKIDSGENHKQTLIRELGEELSINPTDISHYLTYEAVNEITKKKQKIHCYLIKYKGKPNPQKEITGILWYSKQNFKKRIPKISKGIEKYLMPKLIQDNLI
jgi:ADP-ribose pyrophosphatase YjhB (NUDIX family)